MPYSGGKFLANCLALSRHVLCMKEDLARIDVYWTDPIDSEYYNFKLKSIMTSLPTDFSKIKKWATFEFSDNLFRIANNPLVSQRVICHTAHTDKQLIEKIKTHPGLKVVKLVNYQQVAQTCYLLKSNDNNLHQFKYSCKCWSGRLINANFEFNTKTIFSQTDFPVEMKRLYDYLELDDFQMDRITKFHQAYLECQQLT
jgi:hypothetical protein